MACDLPIEDGVKSPADCKCYGAVMRTYHAIAKDVPNSVAMEAAQRVYQYHHPEDSKANAHLTVERWITSDNHVQ
jgi:hypothetical protein